MKKVYYSPKFAKPRIIVEPQMIQRFDGSVRPGKYIEFDNHYFETADEELQKFIEELPNFGWEYVRVDEKAPVVSTAPKVSIVGMANPEERGQQAVADVEAKISAVEKNLNSKIDAITDLIKQLVPAQEEPKRKGRPPKEVEEQV